MTLSIEQTKIELINWLTTVEDEKLLSYLSNLQSSQSNDWWDEISEAERASILAGEDDIRNGRIVPHETVKKIYEKWL